MLDSNGQGDTTSEDPIHASSALDPRLAIGQRPDQLTEVLLTQSGGEMYQRLSRDGRTPQTLLSH